MISEPDNSRRKADARWAIKSPPLLHALDNRFPASQWYAQLPLNDFDMLLISIIPLRAEPMHNLPKGPRYNYW